MDVEGAVRDVGWGDAAWMSSIAVALVIVAVGITFFVILILTALSLAQVKVLRRFVVNFMVSLAASFLNLFLLFGAVFAFPAVVINSIAITGLYHLDVSTGYRHSIGDGKPRWVGRCVTYSLIALSSTIAGAVLIKYTPGVLHKRGQVPGIEWHKDFGTWDGLGGWILVNLGFGSISLLVGIAVETWMFIRDARAFIASQSQSQSQDDSSLRPKTD